MNVTELTDFCHLGNGNDATLFNVEWTSGPFGTPNRAVRFTGADDQ